MVDSRMRQSAAILRAVADSLEDAAPLPDQLEAIGLTPSQMRASRAALGWSAEKLATESGVSLSTIRRYEAGLGGMQRQNQAEIARALKAVGVVSRASPSGLLSVEWMEGGENDSAK